MHCRHKTHCSRHVYNTSLISNTPPVKLVVTHCGKFFFFCGCCCCSYCCCTRTPLQRVVVVVRSSSSSSSSCCCCCCCCRVVADVVFVVVVAVVVVVVAFLYESLRQEFVLQAESKGQRQTTNTLGVAETSLK